MNKFKELNVWKKALELSTEIYKITEHYPKSELFGMISQIRRSCVSVSSNIAEGAGRGTIKEYNHFLNISMASSCELESLLNISINLKYIDEEIFNQLSKEIDEIQKMIRGLQKSFKY
jgi:four helix bundle protein